MRDDIDSTFEPDDVLVPIVPEVCKSATDFVGNEVNVDFEDAMKVLNDSKNQVMTCRFEGLICDDCVEILVNKTKNKVTEGDSLGGMVMILNSCDGAEHRKTQSKKVSIVSFSL